MAFTKIAETPLYYNDRVSHKVEIYLDDPAPPSLQTIETSGDYIFTRGNANPQHKYLPVVNTYVNINFIDKDGFLQNIIESHQDHELKVIIYRDGNVYFKGYITSNKSKKKFLNSLNILSVKVYDGFARLKSFTDFSSFASGKHKISALLRQIMNTLSLDQDVYLWLGIYPKTTTTPVRPGDFIGFDLYEYLTIKPDANYYSLLEDVLKALNIQLYSGEGLYWFRQIVYFEDASIYYQLVNWNTAGSTYGTANNTVTKTVDHLVKDPQKYYLNSVDDIIYRLAIDKDNALEFVNKKKILNWYNPLFKEGTRYWTTSGTVKSLKNSIQVAPGGYCLQSSSEVAENIDIEIEICTTVIRYMESLFDVIDVPIWEVRALETGGVVTQYWNWAGQYWQPSQINREIYFEPVSLVFPGSLVKTTAIDNHYYKTTVIDKIATTVPSMPNTGKAHLRIKLLGGVASANNKPFDVSAQHNYAIVRLKKTQYEEEGEYPTEVLFSCGKSNPKNRLTIDFSIHDEDAYLPISFFDMNDFYTENDGVTYFAKTQLWSPGDKPLMQLITERIIDFDANNIKAFDIEFNNLSAAFTSFFTTVKANFDGEGESVFLPVYEQGPLMSNTSRVILIEHKRKSVTKTFDYEYVFND